MFLLPSIALGVAFALLLGGKPSRLLSFEFRHGWAVFLALGLQVVLFSGLREFVPEALIEPLHLGTYVLLFAFAFANFRHLVLLPLFIGMALNAIAIVSNDGKMPVNPDAWAATGLDSSAASNVDVGADRLAFLGDIFALPRELPFANVFSIGDLFLGIGTVMLIVIVSTTETSRPALLPSRLIEPLRTKSFRRLASGKFVSHLGDWLTVAALVGWIYAATGSVGQVSALLVIRLAPPVLGGGLAATVVDAFPRERLLVLVEFGRGLLVAGALAGILLDIRAIAFIAIAGSGLLAAVSSATVRALVPSILDREQLPAGNAVLELAQDGAMALGALVAGIALATTTAAVALSLDLVTFVVAAFLYMGVRARPLASTARPGKRALAEGFRYIVGSRLLLIVIVAFATATVATGLTNATLPRLLGSELGLGAGAYGFGVAALAGGLALGGAVTGLAPVGDIGGRWIGVALLLMSSLFVVLALTDHAPTALLLLGMIGFLDGTTDVLFSTIIQRDVDPAYHGRVFGLASALFTMSMMGAVALAPLVNRIGAPEAVIMIAGGCLLAAALLALVGTRHSPTSLHAPPGRIALDPRP